MKQFMRPSTRMRTSTYTLFTIICTKIWNKCTNYLATHSLRFACIILLRPLFPNDYRYTYLFRYCIFEIYVSICKNISANIKFVFRYFSNTKSQFCFLINHQSALKALNHEVTRDDKTFRIFSRNLQRVSLSLLSQEI